MRGLRRLGWLALALSLTAVVLAGGLSCTRNAPVETKVNFLRDWEAAKGQAASEGKPIMINFYTVS